MKLRDSNMVIPACTLTVIVWSLYLPVICGGHFLSDDVWQVHFAYKVFNGSLEGIWANFSSNYLQIPGFDFYRPLLTFTFLFDYLLWHTNPAGYLMTNAAYYTVNVLLLYATARSLTWQWTTTRSVYASFLAAALFAVNPLHCEDVAWVSGRADIVSGCYYLLAINLALLARKRRKIAIRLGAIFSFWLAILAKEAAIMLPMVLTAIAFLWPDERIHGDGQGKEQLAQTMAGRISHAVRFSLPFWLSVCIYMLLRWKVLGTLIGGYTGVFGEWLNKATLLRWLDWHIPYLILFPFDQTSKASASWLGIVLLLAYLALLVCAVLRLWRRTFAWQYLGLFLLWLVSTAVPLSTLWSLGPDLEGSRLYFFLTMPLSLAAPLLLLNPETDKAYPTPTSKSGNLLARCSCIALSLIICILFYGSAARNRAWLLAGGEIHAISQQCQAIASSSEAQTKTVVFGMPRTYNGAHIILNGWTFEQLLSPPFTSTPIINRFLTFEPFIAGPPETINATRLKSLLATTKVNGPLVWSRELERFVPLDLAFSAPQAVLPSIQFSDHALPPPTHAAQPLACCQPLPGCRAERHGDQLVFRDTTSRDGFLITGLDLNPFDADFLEFQLRCAPTNQAAVPVTAAWQGISSVANSDCSLTTCFFPDGSNVWKTLRFRLSHNSGWFTFRRIKQLAVYLFPCRSVELRNMRFIQEDVLAPIIDVAEKNQSINGEYFVGNEQLAVLIDRRNVPNAKGMQLEVTRPNFFFDNYLLDARSEIQKYLMVPVTSGIVKLPPELFSKPAYYEIRCRCLGAGETPIGEYSDPVTIFRRSQTTDALDSAVHP